MLNLEVAKEEQSIALSKRNELEESVLIANAQHRDTQRVVTELEARIEALQVQQKVDWAEVQHSAEEFQSWRSGLEKELLDTVDVLKNEFLDVQARNTFLEDRVTTLEELEHAVMQDSSDIPSIVISTDEVEELQARLQDSAQKIWGGMVDSIRTCMQVPTKDVSNLLAKEADLVMARQVRTLQSKNQKLKDAVRSLTEEKDKLAVEIVVLTTQRMSEATAGSADEDPVMDCANTSVVAEQEPKEEADVGGSMMLLAESTAAE